MMFISLPLHHSRNILDMNSGPLSHRMFFGFPLSQITFSSNLMTLSAGIDMDISCPTATLSQSSMIFSTRNVLPLCSLSLTKSIDHMVFGSDGITRGLLTRAGSLFSSACCASRNASVYILYTPSCGSRACRRDEVSGISSRSRHRTLPPRG